MEKKRNYVFVLIVGRHQSPGFGRRWSNINSLGANFVTSLVLFLSEKRMLGRASSHVLWALFSRSIQFSFDGTIPGLTGILP